MSLSSKLLNVITLFHKASSPASLRVFTLLKQVSATAKEHATEDQASDHSHQTHPQRREFDLDVTEDAPTPDQLESMLQYVGANNARSIVRDAKNKEDAIRSFKQNRDSFQWPVTVDWSNGKAVAGDNTSQVLKMVESLPKT